MEVRLHVHPKHIIFLLYFSIFDRSNNHFQIS